MKNRGLGKGLSALIPENSDQSNQDGAVTYVETSSIENNSFQPRTFYDDKKLDDLKKSIEEKGVLQPILVREKAGRFEVIAGERRLKAAKLSNLVEVPVIVKKVTDQEALVIALVENIQREELNPIEEAQAYRRLIQEFQYKQEEVAKSVGKDRSTISNLLRLLKLPSQIQKSIHNNEITVGHARALLSVDSYDLQTDIFEQILKNGLSVRDVEKVVKKNEQPNVRSTKQKETRSFELLTLEEELQRRFGTKVRIVPQRKKRGKIVIEYYSMEELTRLIFSLKSQ